MFLKMCPNPGPVRSGLGKLGVSGCPAGLHHVSAEHDEKHPQPKFGVNPFMGARDMAAWIPN